MLAGPCLWVADVAEKWKGGIQDQPQGLKWTLSPRAPGDELRPCIFFLPTHLCPKYNQVGPFLTMERAMGIKHMHL